MSQRVKNFAVGTDRNPISTSNYGEGTRRVVWEGIEYVVGPNEIKSFVDNTLATSVASIAGSRVADNRDGDGHSRR